MADWWPIQLHCNGIKLSSATDDEKQSGVRCMLITNCHQKCWHEQVFAMRVVGETEIQQHTEILLAKIDALGIIEGAWPTWSTGHARLRRLEQGLQFLVS